MKDAIEGFLDRIIGKPGRKTLEQVAHALMVGIPAFLAVNWIPLDLGASIGCAALMAICLGATREVFQNWGDEPDEDTWFSLGQLPVNGDMLLDMLAYALGGVAAGALGFVL